MSMMSTNEIYKHINTDPISTADSLGTIAENRRKYAKFFQDKSGNEISMDNFYQLLMAELSNQDPMEPMSNTEFISQMANFTALQTQRDSLYYSNANYAQSLVGKTVQVSVTDGVVYDDEGNAVRMDKGVVTNVKMKDKEFFVTVNGKEYALKSVTNVMAGTSGTGDLSTDAAYAANLIGYQVTISAKGADGKPYQDVGIVDHVEIKDGRVMVVVNNLAFYLSDIVSIDLPVYAPETPTGTDGDGEGEDEDGTSGTSGTSGASSNNDDDETETGTQTQSAAVQGASFSARQDAVNEARQAVQNSAGAAQSVGEPAVEYTDLPDIPDLDPAADSEALRALFAS